VQASKTNNSKPELENTRKSLEYGINKQQLEYLGMNKSDIIFEDEKEDHSSIVIDRNISGILKDSTEYYEEKDEDTININNIGGGLGDDIRG